MKIAFFISKGYDSKDEIKLGDVIRNYTPLGVLSIAAVLRDEGHDVKIFNASIRYQYSNKKWSQKIVAFHPDYVGFSTLTYNFDDAYDVCTLLKPMLPNAKMVFGGVHVVIHKQSILKNYPNIDFLIIGDGEYAFRDLVKGVVPKDIPGVFYSENGRILGKEQSLDDLCVLDDLPFPAYDLLENFPHCNKSEVFTYPQTPTTNMVTSRGCPFKCSFCYNATVNKKIRYNSAKYVVDMMEWLYHDYGVRHFDFFDDMFTLDTDRMIDFCDEIKKRKLKISFNCFLRNKFDRGLVLKLKEAGLYVAYIGIESFDQKILDAHKSNIKVKNIKSDLMFLYENEIWVIGLLILGLPGENKQSIDATIKALSEVPIKGTSIFPFMPYYGTPIFDTLLEHGKFLEDINNWRNFNMEKFVYLPKSIPSQAMLEDSIKLIRRAHVKSPYHATIFMKTFKKDLNAYGRLLRNIRHIIWDSLKKSFKKKERAPHQTNNRETNNRKTNNRKTKP